MKRPTITQAQLQAYIDGRLSEKARSEVEFYLAENPSEAEKMQYYKRQNLLLHQIYDPILAEPLPKRVMQISHTKVQRYKYTAAICLSLLTGGIVGWVSNDVTQNQTKESMVLANQAILAHAVYVPEIRHPVEVNANAQEHLVRWLSKRLGNDIKAPSLQNQGFQLVGGRLLPADTGPAAQFMYENAQGLRLTLYIRVNENVNNATGFRFSSHEGVNVFYWIDGKLGYALSGDTGKEKLWQVANTIYEQLGF